MGDKIELIQADFVMAAANEHLATRADPVLVAAEGSPFMIPVWLSIASATPGTGRSCQPPAGALGC